MIYYHRQGSGLVEHKTSVHTIVPTEIYTQYTTTLICVYSFIFYDQILK